jgi:hypothetical protein
MKPEEGDRNQTFRGTSLSCSIGDANQNAIAANRQFSVPYAKLARRA